MKKLLLTGFTIAAIAVSSGAASAQTYGNAYQAPGAVAVPGPYYSGPMVDSQVYLAPGQTYVAPGTQYADQPIYMNGQRYYRDCWWDWGQRKCELKPWW